jgi:hypothetical protein
VIIALDTARARHAMRHVLRLAQRLDADPQAVLCWYHAEGQATRVIQFLRDALAQDASERRVVGRIDARIGE